VTSAALATLPLALRCCWRRSAELSLPSALRRAPDRLTMQRGLSLFTMENGIFKMTRRKL